MTEIALARSFIDALANLEPVATKRTAAFLDRLVRDPSLPGLRPEIVHDAGDRSIRSLRVTDDLRAIAQISADRLLLLFVAHHDEAYLWARGHCIDCSADNTEVAVMPSKARPWPEPVAAMGTEPGGPPRQDSPYGWFCAVEDGRKLCQLLDDEGIQHGLAH